MEKRTTTRVIFSVNSKIKCNNKILEGNIINISLNGILIQTPEKLNTDTEIDVEICMEGTTSQLTVSVQGKVIRSDENGTAIEFKSIDIDSFVHLKNIIAYNEGNEEKIMSEFYQSLKKK